MDIEKILDELTLEEKAVLVMGDGLWKTKSIERFGIPSITVSDGPHGLRKQPPQKEDNININESIPATCFPPASLTSCSFNRNLIRKMGEAIADEAILQDIDIVLGPAVNIKRSPLCGRNFEYVSEDPYLAGEYAVSFINGMQSRGIGTSLKHFAVNSQETLRMNIDSVVDERALREIYLYAFERAVKYAKPYTIMASYNRINGDYGCENKHTLKELLRDEWGYKGLVMSDWTAINDRVKALESGCDLEMPSSGSVRTKEIIDAVKSGSIKENVLNEAVGNILNLIEKCKSTPKIKNENVYDMHNDLAKQIASESMVLLKNNGNILPLKHNKKYALIGAFADTPHYQGGGSSHITPTHLVSMIDVFEEKKLNFTYNPGYEVNSENINEKLISEAVQNAAQADIAIIFIGLTDIYECEGFDRKDISIPPSHISLLNEVYEANKNMIAVLCAGSALEMQWEPLCRAILYAGVTGQAGNEAIYDILFGKVNPSGRLSETFPLKLSDTPCFESFPGGNNSVHYLESIYVGYRYYSTANIPVKYPFGFGLSYSSFEYSDFKSDNDSIGENDVLILKIKVKNIGSMDGAEVIQIYVRNNCCNTFCPNIMLKSFEKVYLKKDEEKESIFTLSYDDFMHYDTDLGWTADTGDYEIFAAANSEDLREEIHIHVQGNSKKQSSAELDTYYHPSERHFNENEFEKLYGKQPAPLSIKYKPIGMNTPFRYCTNTIVGHLLFKIAKKKIAEANRGESSFAARKALISSLGDTPIRSMVVMNEGTNLETGKGLVKMMNGKFFSGLKETLESLKK